MISILNQGTTMTYTDKYGTVGYLVRPATVPIVMSGKTKMPLADLYSYEWRSMEELEEIYVQAKLTYKAAVDLEKRLLNGAKPDDAKH